jgi:hypothetical protein
MAIQSMEYASQDKVKAACTNGTFYTPAWKRYGSVNTMIVYCDQCRRTNLGSCVSEGTVDVCLPCVDKIMNNTKIVYTDVKKLSSQMEHQVCNDGVYDTKSNATCDKCGITNLKACITHDSVHMCPTCVDKYTAGRYCNVKPHVTISNYSRPIADSNMCTKMATSMYRSKAVTLMCNDMYNKRSFMDKLREMFGKS